MIPGPVEFEPEVLRALGSPTKSHLDPDFVECFGRVLKGLRDVHGTTAGQPFVVAGSGTLAMELGAGNVVSEGDPVVIVDTGYFSERMATILTRLGCRVTRLSAPVGGCISPSELDAALVKESAVMVCMTHVDTSTGVRVPVEAMARVARARGALVLVDGVCATGGEALAMDGWGVDVALTASQKALGVPPGLAVVMAGPRALETFRKRATKGRSLYLSWDEWLPVMEGYEAKKPVYFATPPVNLVAALDVSVGQLLREGLGPRIARHGRMAAAFRAGTQALGLRPVPLEGPLLANTLSALYLPEGVDLSLVARIRDEGVVVAGGLHPAIRTTYFRVGHMGAVQENDVLATLGALERGLARSGQGAAAGRGVAAAQAALAAPR